MNVPKIEDVKLVRLFKKYVKWLSAHPYNPKKNILKSYHWINLMRNKPCICKSHMKSKFCCIRKHEKLRNNG